MFGQVYTELDTLGSAFGLKADVFHGGAAYGPQMRALSDGLDILVATPGRIMDHLQRGALSLADVRHAVLDEADEMLNMGFADDIETIFSYVDVSQRWQQSVVFVGRGVAVFCCCDEGGGKALSVQCSAPCSSHRFSTKVMPASLFRLTPGSFKLKGLLSVLRTFAVYCVLGASRGYERIVLSHTATSSLLPFDFVIPLSVVWMQTISRIYVPLPPLFFLWLVFPGERVPGSAVQRHRAELGEEHRQQVHREPSHGGRCRQEREYSTPRLYTVSGLAICGLLPRNRTKHAVITTSATRTTMYHRYCYREVQVVKAI